MFTPRRPSDATVAQFLARQRTAALSYEPVGLHASARLPGFHVDVQRAQLGVGDEVFARARDALRTWRMFEMDWLSLHPRGAGIEIGTNLATVIHHLGFWSVQPTRVVSHLPASQRRFGFAYGTLHGHAECGEELFAVDMDETGSVWYEIRAVSRPEAALARIGYPFTRWLQARFRRDSLRAMRATCGGAERV